MHWAPMTSVNLQMSLLHKLFMSLGFRPVAKHKREDLVLYKQGDINFILNLEPGSYAEGFAKKHGPCACAMGFRVKDAKFAFEEACKRGAKANFASFTLKLMAITREMRLESTDNR